MPAKHRRIQRRIAQSRKINTSINSAPPNIEPNTKGLPVKSSAPFGEKSLTTVDLDSLKYVFTELKWIGVVTGIILVLLVISYIIFH
jgi:hypothetical protein